MTPPIIDPSLISDSLLSPFLRDLLASLAYPTVVHDSKRKSMHEAFTGLFQAATPPANLDIKNVDAFQKLKPFFNSPWFGVSSATLYHYHHHVIPRIETTLAAYEQELQFTQKALRDQLVVHDINVDKLSLALEDIPRIKVALKQIQTTIRARLTLRKNLFASLRHKEGITDAVDDDDLYIANSLMQMGVSPIQTLPHTLWSQGLTPAILKSMRTDPSFITPTSTTLETKRPIEKVSIWQKMKQPFSGFTLGLSIWKKLGLSLAIFLLAGAAVYFFLSGGGLIGILVLAVTGAVTVGPILIRQLVRLKDHLVGTTRHKKFNFLVSAVRNHQKHFQSFCDTTRAHLSSLETADLESLGLALNGWSHFFDASKKRLEAERPYILSFFRRGLRKRFNVLMDVFNEHEKTIKKLKQAIVKKLLEGSIATIDIEKQYYQHTQTFGRPPTTLPAFSTIQNFIRTHSDDPNIETELNAFFNRLNPLSQLLEKLVSEQNHFLIEKEAPLFSGFSSHTPNGHELTLYFERAKCFLTFEDPNQKSGKLSALERLFDILTGRSPAAAIHHKNKMHQLNTLLEALAIPKNKRTIFLNAIITYLIKIHAPTPSLISNFSLFPADTQALILSQMHRHYQMTRLSLPSSEADTRGVHPTQFLTAYLNAQMAQQFSIAGQVLERLTRYWLNAITHYEGTPLDLRTLQTLDVLPESVRHLITRALAQARVQRGISQGSPVSAADRRLLLIYALDPAAPPLQLAAAPDWVSPQMETLITQRLITATAESEAPELPAHQLVATQTANMTRLVHFPRGLTLSSHTVHLIELLIHISRISAKMPFDYESEAAEEARMLYLALSGTPSHLATLRAGLINTPDIFLGFISPLPIANALLEDKTIPLCTHTLAAMLIHPNAYRSTVKRILNIRESSEAKVLSKCMHDAAFDDVMRNSAQSCFLDVDTLFEIFLVFDRHLVSTEQLELAQRFLMILSKHANYRLLLLKLYLNFTVLKQKQFGLTIKTQLQTYFKDTDFSEATDTYVYDALFCRHQGMVFETLHPPGEQTCLFSFADKKPPTVFTEFEKQFSGVQTPSEVKQLSVTTLYTTLSIGSEIAKVHAHFQRLNKLIEILATGNSLNHIPDLARLARNLKLFWARFGTRERMDALCQGFDLYLSEMYDRTLHSFIKIEMQAGAYLSGVHDTLRKELDLASQALATANTIDYAESGTPQATAALAKISLFSRALVTLQNCEKIMACFEETTAMHQDVPEYPLPNEKPSLSLLDEIPKLPHDLATYNQFEVNYHGWLKVLLKNGKIYPETEWDLLAFVSLMANNVLHQVIPKHLPDQPESTYLSDTMLPAFSLTLTIQHAICRETAMPFSRRLDYILYGFQHYLDTQKETLKDPTLLSGLQKTIHYFALMRHLKKFETKGMPALINQFTKMGIENLRIFLTEQRIIEGAFPAFLLHKMTHYYHETRTAGLMPYEQIIVLIKTAKTQLQKTTEKNIPYRNNLLEYLDTLLAEYENLHKLRHPVYRSKSKYDNNKLSKEMAAILKQKTIFTPHHDDRMDVTHNEFVIVDMPPQNYPGASLHV